MAEGKHQNMTITLTPTDTTDSSPPPPSKRIRKSSSSNNNNNNATTSLDSDWLYLKQRSAIRLFDWDNHHDSVTWEGSFLGDCKKFQWGSITTTTNTMLPCQSCHRSTAHHRLRSTQLALDLDNNSDSPVHVQLWNLYILIRNIRYEAWTVLQQQRLHSRRRRRKKIQCRRHDDVTFESYQSVMHPSNHIHATLDTHVRDLSKQNFTSTLLETIQTLKKEMRLLLLVVSSDPKESTSSNNNKETSFSSSSFRYFTKLVRIIMACDAVYYRLYYEYMILLLHLHHATITTTTTTNTHQSRAISSSRGCRIPHPIQYWGEMVVRSSSSSRTEDKMMTIFPFKVEPQNLTHENVLSYLHSIRMEETKLLFGNRYFWTQSNILQELYSGGPAQEDGPNNHEHYHIDEHSSAPHLFSQWRDSCRDFLCHLYAYATISNAVWEDGILPALQRRQLYTILELGAGTGFWAHYVTQQTQFHPMFQVFAYDVPTNNNNDNHNQNNHHNRNNNEYHGRTPPFFDSMQLGDGTSKGFWKNLHSDTSLSPKNTILMLCYPPPDSSMALTTVQNYVQWVEKKNKHHPKQSNHSPDKPTTPTILHIGEFRGLTGTKEFEKYMLDHYTIVERWPCQNWGTDASEVTLWEKKSTKNHRKTHKHHTNKFHNAHASSVSILNPCAGCKVRESTRRCRLLRTLNYCSAHCFQNHQHERREKFREMAVLLDEKDERLQFDLSNDRHFSSLE